MRNFIISVFAEMKKVQWPTLKEMANLLLFTVAICAIIAVLMLGLDVFFLDVREYLLNL